MYAIDKLKFDLELTDITKTFENPPGRLNEALTVSIPIPETPPVTMARLPVKSIPRMTSSAF